MKELFAYIFACLIIVFIIYIQWHFIVRPIYLKLCRIERGKTTTAEIPYFIDTLARIQNRPLIHIVLRFDVNGSIITTGKLKILVKKQELRKLKIGGRVLIKYDPKKLENIEILSVLDK